MKKEEAIAPDYQGKFSEVVGQLAREWGVLTPYTRRVLAMAKRQGWVELRCTGRRMPVAEAAGVWGFRKSIPLVEITIEGVGGRHPTRKMHVFAEDVEINRRPTRLLTVLPPPQAGHWEQYWFSREEMEKPDINPSTPLDQITGFNSGPLFRERGISR